MSIHHTSPCECVDRTDNVLEQKFLFKPVILLAARTMIRNKGKMKAVHHIHTARYQQTQQDQ